MSLWIELDDKLPYALTIPSPAPTPDMEYYVAAFFNVYRHKNDVSVGEYEFTLVPDKGEAEEALARGVIEEIPTEITVKVKEISSILASKR